MIEEWRDIVGYEGSANKHIPESSILKQFIEYAESKELQDKHK